MVKNDKHVLVVGFGLAGAIVSERLYQKGVPFRIISGDLPKASNVAAGMFNPIVFRRLVKTWKADEIIPFLYNYYSVLEQQLGTSFFHPLKKYKLLSKQEADFWRQKTAPPSLDKYLSASIENLEGYGDMLFFEAAAQVKEAGWLDIPVFIKALEEKWKKHNWIDFDQFDYHSLQLVDDGLSYGGQDYSHVLFCEGSYVSHNPWFRWLPFKPTKGEVLTFRSDQLKLDFSVNKNGFVLPYKNNTYKIGATYNWKDLTFETTEEGKRTLEEKLNTIVKVPYEIVNQQAGVRPTTNDRRPVLGRHPGCDRILIFNGLGTKGVMLAPFFAQHLMEYLFDGKALDPEVAIQRYLKYFKKNE